MNRFSAWRRVQPTAGKIGDWDLQTLQREQHSGRHQEKTEAYRRGEGEKDAHLAISVSAALPYRSSDRFEAGMHSGLVQIDLDDVDDYVAERGLVERFPFTAYVFESCTEGRIKAFVELAEPYPESQEEHAAAWERAAEEFRSAGWIVDKAGSNVAHACFIPHDPSAAILEVTRPLEWRAGERAHSVQTVSPTPMSSDGLTAHQQAVARALEDGVTSDAPKDQQCYYSQHHEGASPVEGISGRNDALYYATLWKIRSIRNVGDTPKANDVRDHMLRWNTGHNIPPLEGGPTGAAAKTIKSAFDFDKRNRTAAPPKDSDIPQTIHEALSLVFEMKAPATRAEKFPDSERTDYRIWFEDDHRIDLTGDEFDNWSVVRRKFLQHGGVEARTSFGPKDSGKWSYVQQEVIRLSEEVRIKTDSDAEIFAHWMIEGHEMQALSSTALVSSGVTDTKTNYHSQKSRWMAFHDALHVEGDRVVMTLRGWRWLKGLIDPQKRQHKYMDRVAREAFGPLEDVEIDEVMCRARTSVAVCEALYRLDRQD